MDIPFEVRRPGWFVSSLWMLAALGALNVASAQNEAEKRPAHAQAKSYGKGWECSWGYTQVGASCAAVVIPANAHLNFSGTGWECERGYLKENGRHCVAVKVPKNGFLDGSKYGSGWHCNRGYRAVGKECVPLVIPINA